MQQPTEDRVAVVWSNLQEAVDDLSSYNSSVSVVEASEAAASVAERATEDLLQQHNNSNVTAVEVEGETLVAEPAFEWDAPRFSCAPIAIFLLLLYTSSSICTTRGT